MKFAFRAKVNELEQQRQVFDSVMQRIDAQQDMSNDLLERELTRFQSRRTIATSRLEIENQLMSSSVRFLVIKSVDGCGASVRIPQYVAELPCFAMAQVLCTEPTMSKARLLADQVAYEYRDSEHVVPDEGHMASQFSAASGRLAFLGENEMLNLLKRARLSTDPDTNPLRSVGCVIVGNARKTVIYVSRS
jgi:hypothetical protein